MNRALCPPPLAFPSKDVCIPKSIEQNYPPNLPKLFALFFFSLEKNKITPPNLPPPLNPGVRKSALEIR